MKGEKMSHRYTVKENVRMRCAIIKAAGKVKLINIYTGNVEKSPEVVCITLDYKNASRKKVDITRK